MKRAFLGLAVLVVALLAGACQSPFYKPAHWRVEVSTLDYVQFLCGASVTNNPESNATPHAALKVELLGSGYLTCWEGRSPRVANDFWETRESDRWDEIETDSVHVNKEYVKACFQHLVDTGFFEEDMLSSLKKKGEVSKGIMVLASINGRKKAAFTADPRVAASVSELMKQF